jgi:hypothetical protein
MRLQNKQKRERFSKLRLQLKRLVDEIEKLVPNFFYDQAMIKGSVVELKRKCGKEKCRCNEGELHLSKVLSASISGKTRMRAIPKDQIEEVKKKVDRYQKHRKSRARLGEIQREMLKIVDETETLRREEMK